MDFANKIEKKMFELEKLKSQQAITLTG